jgi:outer membrane murein-binding lipoprotein Lpp
LSFRNYLREDRLLLLKIPLQDCPEGVLVKMHLEGHAIKGRWCGGRPYGCRLKAITDPSRLDAYGNPAKIGTTLAIDTAQVTDVEKRLKAGGRDKYLLSGLFKCKTCGAHYVIADKYSYACNSFLNGGACSNEVRVNRVSIEGTILNAVRDQLSNPVLVKQMAAEMEGDFAAMMDKAGAREAAAPKELQELDARLAAEGRGRGS